MLLLMLLKSVQLTEVTDATGLIRIYSLGTTSFTQQTPLDNLLHSNWLVPFLFFAGFSEVLVDGVGRSIWEHSTLTEPLADLTRVQSYKGCGGSGCFYTARRQGHQRNFN